MNQTAQGLAALGRGPDTQLVHMAPSEVAGLQALAQRHGGSLTTNPDTGLPEAGFLSSILPMVIGAGLAATGVGAPMAALMVGGGYGLATGSLSKGLMAGLGAYGGAGLGTSLAAAAPAAATEVAAGSIVPQAQGLAEIGTASAQAAGAGSPTLLNAAQQANTGLGTGFGAAFDPSAAMYPVAPPTQPMYLSQTGLTATPPPQIALGPTPTPQPTFARMGAGLGDVFSSGEKALEFAGKNVMPLGAMGISALAGMQPDELNAPAADKGMIRPFTYSREKIPGAYQDVAGAPMSSKERRYFTDQFTALTPYKAPGPEYMAVGGPVEDMSNANAIGASTGYPQSGISTGAYSTPFQQPIGQNVVTGAQDAAVDPYTGQQQFAMGGVTGSGNLNLNIPIDLGGSGGGGFGGSSFGGGYQAAGSGGGGQSMFSGQNNAASGSFSAGTQGFAGLGDNNGQAQTAQKMYDQMRNPQLSSAQQNMQTVQSMGQALPPPQRMGPGVQGYDQLTPEQQIMTEQMRMNAGGPVSYAQGGISDLGGYSDGGRLLRGPGDGVSDSIPARIGAKQEARLADGEFVVPARIVSELGNGSTEAGARQLYAMMDRVQKNRKKSMGKDKVAADSKSSRLLPA